MFRSLFNPSIFFVYLGTLLEFRKLSTEVWMLSASWKLLNQRNVLKILKCTEWHEGLVASLFMLFSFSHADTINRALWCIIEKVPRRFGPKFPPSTTLTCDKILSVDRFSVYLLCQWKCRRSLNFSWRVTESLYGQVGLPLSCWYSKRKQQRY